MAELLKDSNWQVRRKAVKKLKDHDSLDQVVKNDENEKVRQAAVKKLKKEETLAWVCKNDKCPALRELALKKLDPAKWQDLFADIAENDEDDEMRIPAIKRLDEKKWRELLAKIAGDSNNGVFARYQAIAKLQDKELLTGIVRNDKDENIRRAAEKSLKKASGLIIHRLSPF